jgi:hypothetical protein
LYMVCRGSSVMSSPLSYRTLAMSSCKQKCYRIDNIATQLNK